MIMVHGGCYLPFPIKQIVQLVIDGAAEGFLMLAGVMVGWRLIPLYNTSRKTAINKILKRTFQILFLHYFLILTIDLPLKFFINHQLHGTEAFLNYLLNVLLWQEQPYMLDILPIFVTMFAITSIFLELYYRKLEIVVCFGSAFIFIIGLIWPYAMSVKETVAFPAMQWQIYFVIGMFLGHRYNKINQVNNKILRKWAYCTLSLFVILVFFRHGMAFSPEWLITFLSTLRFNIQKFPISLWGFVFSALLLATVSLSSVIYLLAMKQSYIFRTFIPTFGRNSLLSFSLHVYFDYLIKIIDKIFLLPISVVRLLYFVDMITIFLLIVLWEKQKAINNSSIAMQRA